MSLTNILKTFTKSFIQRIKKRPESKSERNLIIIPTYNERENIKRLIPAIFALLPDIYIMIVDDNSPDGTAEEVNVLKDRYKNISLLKRNKKEGLGAAYKHALVLCKTDSSIKNIVTMDADGSHDPKYIPLLLSQVKNYDLVIGSRYIAGGAIENWSPFRKSLSYFGNRYAQMFTRLPIKDLTSGFVAFRSSLLKKIPIDTISTSGYAYQIHFKYECLRQGASYVEIPIVFREREYGQSKITFGIIVEGIITPLWFFYKKLY